MPCGLRPATMPLWNKTKIQNERRTCMDDTYPISTCSMICVDQLKRERVHLDTQTNRELISSANSAVDFSETHFFKLFPASSGVVPSIIPTSGAEALAKHWARHWRCRALRSAKDPCTGRRGKGLTLVLIMKVTLKSRVVCNELHSAENLRCFEGHFLSCGEDFERFFDNRMLDQGDRS
ncbi:hypothetical protein NE237_008146 [Protea cynaroides]|uniref:Uncharacterized protein n=1 Tax=Protea cynaroides TaxID=273540 RepID=A0A9Q0KQS3_9MAGN|nr:hypothetical protein NE237_008146 [Protea cynaroides]